MRRKCVSAQRRPSTHCRTGFRIQISLALMWLLPADSHVETGLCLDTYCFPLIIWTFSRIFKMQHKLGVSWGYRTHCSLQKMSRWLWIRHLWYGRLLFCTAKVGVQTLLRDFYLVTQAWKAPWPERNQIARSRSLFFGLCRQEKTDKGQETYSRPVLEQLWLPGSLSTQARNTCPGLCRATKASQRKAHYLSWNSSGPPK